MTTKEHEALENENKPSWTAGGSTVETLEGEKKKRRRKKKKKKEKKAGSEDLFFWYVLYFSDCLFRLPAPAPPITPAAQ